MRKEISDFILLLCLIPTTGFFLSWFITVFTEKIKIIKRKHKYFWMRIILFFYFIIPITIVFIFLGNRKANFIWIGGDFDCMYNYRNSILYYDYLEKKEFWILEGFFLIWIVGIVILMVIRSIHGKIQLKELQKVSVLQTGQQFKMLKTKAMAGLGIKREIPVYRSELLEGSFLSGTWKPVIYLPKSEISEEELYCILRHEFVHYKRRDVWFQRLLLIVKGIYWVNPLIYLFCKDFLDSCELACDEVALENQEKEVVISYIKTIFRMSAFGLEFRDSVGFSSKTMCERRIRAIMSRNNVQKKCLGVLLSGVITCLFPIVSYAAVEGAVYTQTKLGTVLEEAYASPIAKESDSVYEEIIETVTEDSEVAVVHSLNGAARGDTEINHTISGRCVLGPIDLLEGDEVEFWLVSSDHDKTDKFTVGISGNGTERRVNSVNGMIAYTFTIETSGSYELFIQSWETVSLTGVITIP